MKSKRHLHPPLEHATEVLEAIPSIEAVYLFSSVVKGKEHEESDLDLGIVFSSPDAAPSKWDFVTKLVARGFDRVDLVYFMRQILPCVMRWSVTIGFFLRGKALIEEDSLSIP